MAAKSLGVALALLLAAFPAHAARSRAEPIAKKKGLPKPGGLGKLVILTNLKGSDRRFRVVKEHAKRRGAKILKFKEDEIGTVRKSLARIGPEFVALAVTPETVDINFHYEVLELSRDLDDDPMPDFHFGYLCARDEHDLGRLLERVERREKERPAQPKAGTANIDGDGSHLSAYDYILHFGHGQAWCVEKGLTGQQVGALDLPKAPVVFSGACFNGVLSRSYHPCAYQFVFLKPVTVAPDRLMTLNWVHAGVSGYLAALEGDRGEMAMAEWEYFRSRAATLGETIGYQYRLAFVSVYADFTKFPRYRPGYKKRMSHYDVMLRGMVSRLLLSDPSFRPLDKPLDKPVHTIQVAREGDRLLVDVTVERYAQGLHVNYLCKSKRGVFDHRCYVRVELPADLSGKFGESTVEIRNGETLATVTRHHVRPEVWGGKRYLNLQVEGPMGVLKPGTKVRFVLPITG